MRRRSIALATIACIAALSLTGCTTAPPGSGAAHAGSTPTLDRTTLPTAVGTKWVTVRAPQGGVAVDFKVAGPWKFTAQSGWSETPNEIVDSKTVPGIEKFSDVTFVTMTAKAGNPTYYYPRRVTDQWVEHLGRIEVRGDVVDSVPLEAPSHFWPLKLTVGDSYVVTDDAQRRTDATVLARNTAEVPAGRIENTYLVRFEYKPKNGSDKPSTYYYMFAPNVGFVALIHPGAGDEKRGFTSVKQLDLLATLPKK